VVRNESAPRAIAAYVCGGTTNTVFATRRWPVLTSSTGSVVTAFSKFAS
jgi:hypothetical protein